jgi:hypothetical protein
MVKRQLILKWRQLKLKEWRQLILQVDRLELFSRGGGGTTCKFGAKPTERRGRFSGETVLTVGISIYTIAWFSRTHLISEPHTTQVFSEKSK